MIRTSTHADSIRPATPRSFEPTSRKSVCSVAWRAVAGIALLSGAGCDDDTSREFREAALDSIQRGVSTLLDGLVDGAFAVIDVDAENAAARRR